MKSQRRLPHKFPLFSEVAICKAFIFCLITLSIFREKIHIGIWYVKPMELYIGICLPLIILIFAWNFREFSRPSALFLISVFIMFFFMNWLSGISGTQYISPNERFLYLLRLGLIVVVTMVLLVSLSSKYQLLIGSVYKGFLIAGILIILSIIFFPQYKTSLRRFTGPIGDPNYTAAFLIICTNVAVFWAMVTTNRLLRLVYTVLGIVFFVTIIVSLSRGGLLGAIISLSILLQSVVISKSQIIHGYLYVRKVYLNRAVAAITMVILTVVLIAMSYPELSANFVSRLSIERIKNQDDQMRQSLWKLGTHSIAENPIGYGMGQMRVKHQQLDPGRQQFGHSTEVHNLLLQIGGAFGWPGIFFFIIFQIFLFRICFKLLRKKHYAFDLVRGCPIPLITSYLGLFVQAMLFNFFFLKYYWILIALVLSYYEYDKKISRTEFKQEVVS